MPLPRNSSRTLLRESISLLPAYKSSPRSKPPLISSRFPMLHLRKSRRRSLLVLLIFLFLSTYFFFVRQSPLSPPLSRFDADALTIEQIVVQRQHTRNSEPTPSGPGIRRKHLAQNQRPLLHLDSTQELAAISSFLASLPQNVIPSFVDPSLPINPELVLDFDTRSSRAREEVNSMVEDVWTRNPVFLYCKLYSPLSRELKAILDTLRLAPAPTIIDIDIRDDFDVLRPIIHRLTSTTELPVLLIGGKSVGSMSDIRALHKSGELQKRITEAGAIINGAKRQKHKR